MRPSRLAGPRHVSLEPMSDRTSILTTGQKSQSNPEVGPRLVELLDRCGIAAAHFASRGTADLKGLLSQQPGRVASLTVLCPAVLDTRTLARIGERLLVVTGDRGPGARRVQAGFLYERHQFFSESVGVFFFAHQGVGGSVKPEARLELFVAKSSSAADQFGLVEKRFLARGCRRS